VLREWGLNGLALDSELLVSELVTNAVKATAGHDEAAVRLRLSGDSARILDRLPDFLDLEDGGEFALLGQDELGKSVFEAPCGTRLPAPPPKVTGQSKIPNGESIHAGWNSAESELKVKSYPACHAAMTV
jgi:hypothetical protein